MATERVLTEEELEEIRAGEIKIENEKARVDKFDSSHMWVPYNRVQGIHDAPSRLGTDYELSEGELENVYGGPIRSDDLPSKFKEVKQDESEMSMDDLDHVYGGPIRPEDLPEDYLTERNQDSFGR